MRFLLSIIFLCLSSHSLASPTVENFAKLPMFSMPKLSPDGESIAYVTTHQDQVILVTRPLKKSNSKYKTGIIPLTDLHIRNLEWVTNTRLLVTARMTIKRGRIGLINLSRLFSVDRDGGNAVFFDMEPNNLGYFAQHPGLIDLLPTDPNHVLLALDHHPERAKWGSKKIHKVNIHTGEKTLVFANKPGFMWVIPDNNADIRIAVKGTHGGTKWSMYYRGTTDVAWQLIQKKSYFSNERMQPIRFDYEDNNILLITSDDLEDEDYDQDDSDIYRYDLTKKEVVGPYKHAARDKAKKLLSKSFPDDRVNLVSSINKVTLDKAIYEVHSDIHPSQFFIYDAEQKRADYLGSSYPQLEAVTLTPMEEIEYTARDGLAIPAYLTLPQTKSAEKPPLIVYPHGGPWARDYWGFDNYVQFFANKGYAVFQPQFRGSTGFGAAHLSAGHKQWGLGIQDDITDGVKWLIEQGRESNPLLHTPP